MAILNNSNAISSGGYDINNSLRFRASASAYLNRTPGSNGSLRTWTASFWYKNGAIDSNQTLFSNATASDSIGFRSSRTIEIYFGAGSANLVTTQVFRDVAAWYHIVVAVDTTQATAANRIKLYVNGSQVTAFSTATYPAQNYDTSFNKASTAQEIGRRSSGSDLFLDGYMAEVNWIDGQQLTPSSFGETDTTTGSWKPKPYSGTYGTNGFYLKFSDIATTSSSNAGLGKDFSGNANYWTTNNISVTAGTTYDAMIDSPTNTSATVANYCVLSPLNYRTFTGSVVPTISNANLTVTQSSTTASCIGTATMGATASGKYYWEATFVSGSGSNNSFLGVVAGQLQNTTANDLGYYSTEYSYKSGNGNKYSNNTFTAYGSSYTSGDVIGFALDLDAGTLTFYKNNTSQGVAFSSLSASETYFPAFDTYYNNTFAYNFGQRPFSYTPPTGFVRLNTYNLPDSTIKKGNTVMDATLYTGTGASLSVTNAGGFKPDFVWVKGRSGATDNALYDSVRGTTKDLVSNSAAAETTQAQGLTAFGTGGFTVGTLAKMNTSAATYVGWQWQAGQGSTSSNTSGSITSTVSVNTTAGFSIVTYTGNGSAGATIGHSLGIAPKMFIVKNRSNGGNDWSTWHTSISPSSNFQVYLSSSAASLNTWNVWNSTSPSTTTLTLGTDALVNGNGQTYVAYCWAAIAGYSAFGSYTGNGSTDGTMVYTGFKPKYVMIKRTDTTSNWVVMDTARGTYNASYPYLDPDLSDAEGGPIAMDFLSNGFKLRLTSAAWNASGGTYIYMAFAENPFKNSLAR
jgi:hypothetical protein